MELLTEKYRPKTIEDLVIINKSFSEKLKQWKENKTIDSHLIFYGPAGTGKSSSANVIINELGITDYMVINGSDKTGIDDTRKIIEYASVPTLDDKIKIIVFEEFERLSAQAQDSLKYVLEKYSSWCRFIFTTNNINKITPPIISRCETFNFQKIDMEQFVLKIISILNNEKIKFKQEDITSYIQYTYPDLRKCINEINKNTILVDNGYELEPYVKDDGILNSDKIGTIIKYLHNQCDCMSLQKELATKFNDEEIENIYKLLYNHLELITVDKNKWEPILLNIAKYLYQNTTVAFKDLNLMACLVDIKMGLNN